VNASTKSKILTTVMIIIGPDEQQVSINTHTSSIDFPLKHVHQEDGDIVVCHRTLSSQGRGGRSVAERDALAKEGQQTVPRL